MREDEDLKLSMQTKTPKLRPLTYRQFRALDSWFRNRRKSKAEALREAGYGKSIVRQPHKVFNSPAIQRELELRGHGIHGILDNQEPRAEILEPEPPQRPKLMLDFSKLTPEVVQDLREKLARIPD